MHIEQIYTSCLAQGAYYITSAGEAAIIDPLREVKPYLQRLERDGATLKYIFETHFHADFVSGHLDLAAKTDAPIVYGVSAQPDFEALIAADGQVFSIGNITIKAIHTPGHTLESTCYLLCDERGKPTALFSGDTLFLGDVGRPDLAQKVDSMTQEDLAGLLYDSLYIKILPLPDDVTVYPAHGAGSACGKSMMKETVDSLGNQKTMNYALNQPNKTAFIAAVLDGLLPPPNYFGHNVAMNKKGYESLDSVLNKGLRGLSPMEFTSLAQTHDALILDARSNADFHAAFIPASVNIGLSGDFAPWVGALVSDTKQPLLLITDDGKAEEAATRLARVGFDNQLGYLEGGIAAWLVADGAINNKLDAVPRITADAFAAEVQIGTSQIIDVRKASEYEIAHLRTAQNKPLADINDWINDLRPDQHFYLHCAGGYRSMTAASILKARGYHNFTEVAGGFAAIQRTDIASENIVGEA